MEKIIGKWDYIHTGIYLFSLSVDASILFIRLVQHHEFNQFVSTENNTNYTTEKLNKLVYCCISNFWNINISLL